MKQTVAIIGAGITGLSLASFLSPNFNVILIEKEKEIGGLCGSFVKEGFTLDYGPHKLYPQNSISLNAIKNLYSDNPSDLLVVRKKSRISLRGRYFSYPLKMTELLLKFNPFLAMKLLFSYSTSLISNFIFRKDLSSYENFLKSKFGKGIYELVFKSNANKIWGNPQLLSSDLAKTRISSPSLFKLIMNILIKTENPEINAKTFFYPKNYIQDLMNKFKEVIIRNNGKIITSSIISELIIKGKSITGIKLRNKKIKIDYLISTSTLHDSLNLLKAPKEIKEKASHLKLRGLALVYFVINKPMALKDNWIFFPGKDFIFQRVSEQKSFSSFNQPQEKSVITAEISLRPEIENLKDSEIIQKAKNDLIKSGILKENDFVYSFLIKKEQIYPVYSLDYKKNLNLVLNWIDSNFTNFITCGRNGLFNYNNMDHCIDMSAKIAEHLKNKGNLEQMKKLRRYFETYKIVD
jgi:protoporphyrinogen oxidase